MDTSELIHAYYAALNTRDLPAVLELLAEDVVHDINQGERQMGKARFAAFMDRKNRCYRERLSDIVVMVNQDGSRAAAEFVVHGEYLADDDGLPAAHGQKYVLPAGAFFYVKAGKVARISNYYNLNDWVEQVA